VTSERRGKGQNLKMALLVIWITSASLLAVKPFLNTYEA